MAKHHYAIPLHKAHAFIKTSRTKLNTLSANAAKRELYATFGKASFTMEIEAFITFFKIDRDVTHANRIVHHLNSAAFIGELAKRLGFESFVREGSGELKPFFYAFCYLFARYEADDFHHVMQKSFLHVSSAFNKSTPVTIDYEQMAHALAQSKKLEIANSFGEAENGSFFTIRLNGREIVSLQGKKIKTLRKKGYKQLFYHLLELDEATLDTKEAEAIEQLYMLKDV